MNKNVEYLRKNKILYVKDDFEGAVFKFTDTGTGNYCEVKRSKQRLYKVECTTDITYETLLGGEIIT